MRAMKSSWIEEFEFYDIDVGKTNTFYKYIRGPLESKALGESLACWHAVSAIERVAPAEWT